MVCLNLKGSIEMKPKVIAEGKMQRAKCRGQGARSIVLHVIGSMLIALCLLLFISHSYCDTSASNDRPSIVNAIKPVYLPKTTKLEVISDKPLKMKQMKLSKSGVLRVEIFNATTSLPDSINIDKGILRGVALEPTQDELKLYVSLTEPVIYEVESTARGLVIIFQNPVLEQLISLNINDEPLSTVLLTLFIEYGANVIAGSNVSGNITAHLVDVPLKAALDEILGVEGYGYIEENGLIRVVTAKELAARAEAKANPLPDSNIVVMESRIFQLEFANVSEMQTMLEQFVGTDGSIVADPRTNSLIITSAAENLDRISELISQLDKEIEKKETTGSDHTSSEGTGDEQAEEPATPIIAKKVFKLNYLSPETANAILKPFLSSEGAIEVVKEEEDASGTGGSSRSGGGSSSPGGSGAGGGMMLGNAVGQGGYIVVSDKPEVIELIAEEIARIDMRVPQVEIEAYIVEGTLSNDNDLGIDWTAVSKDEEMQFAFSGDVGGILTKGIINAEKFAGILNALATNSKLNVLSNPRITTLENQPAEFHSGDKIPYSRIFIQDGIEQIDTVFEDIGIVLAVTPQVKEDGMISLMLATSVSSEGGFTPNGQPRISTRTTQNQVLVRSGDTAVIAGLISEKSSEAVAKVPIIGDIPLIGRIFSTEREVKQKSEVTVFITPRIIP